MNRRDFLKLLPIGVVAMLVPPTTGPKPSPSPAPPKQHECEIPYLTDADAWFLTQAHADRYYNKPYRFTGTGVYFPITKDMKADG